MSDDFKPKMTVNGKTVTLPADSVEFDCWTFDTDICIGETERDDTEQACISGTMNFECTSDMKESMRSWKKAFQDNCLHRVLVVFPDGFTLCSHCGKEADGVIEKELLEEMVDIIGKHDSREISHFIVDLDLYPSDILIVFKPQGEECGNIVFEYKV